MIIPLTHENVLCEGRQTYTPCVPQIQGSFVKLGHYRTVSPTDDPARTFAGGQRCQRVVDAVEMVGASDKFAELQFTRLIERDEVRDVQQRTPRTVERADQALLLHHEREGGD